MLSAMIKNGFGNDEDFNCAEKILHGSNIAYNLGLNKDALKLSSGFGGGMSVGGLCGAVAASIMVLSALFVQKKSHESTKIKEMTTEFLTKYENDMKALDCNSLKKMYRTPEYKCHEVIYKASEILDEIYLNNR